ncbi:hypothetical protein F4561_000659 [Lipingzhangella halophila]|uniref:Uncharacterized protein n=1 Tax=Lipingzhangella halophila TaxID=1783352 RepID=A0A7W7RD87_9ACTN|nr:hypothetical protein [Lipingzhangella halophila]MBB4929839.1 hypothetical protein [Lipingzhangella halophila]
MDAAAHHVTITLRTKAAGGTVDYNLVLEGVTDFSFFDEDPAPRPGAEVSDIRSQNDPDTLHLDFTFGHDAAGLTVTCAKLVMHRVRPS